VEILISGHRLVVTDAIRGYTEEKLSRLCRHFELLDRIEAMLKIDGPQQCAEFVTHVRRGADIVVRGRGKDMYAAVDSAIDKLERRLRREKEKRVEKRSRPNTLRSTERQMGEGTISGQAPASDETAQ